jgi:hypothetical protein
MTASLIKTPPLSFNEAKANATEVDQILGEPTPATLGGGEQPRAVRDHKIHAAEALTTAIGICDEAHSRVVKV